MFLAISGVNTEISQASSTKAGSTCQKVGTASRQGNSILQCQRKNGKLIWVAAKLQTAKKDPLPMVASDDFEVSTDSGDLTATIPSENLMKIVSEFHATSFVARFVLGNATFTIPVTVASDNLEIDGSLNLIKPNADSGDWTVAVAAINATGQGSWSAPQDFTVPPVLQSVIAPNFTLTSTNGNLIATILASDVQQSEVSFGTTAFLAEFISPTGAVTRENYAIQDDIKDATLTLTSPVSGTWSVSIAGTNDLGQGNWSPQKQFTVAEITAPAPQDLQCGVTPQVAFQKPGWLST